MDSKKGRKKSGGSHSNRQLVDNLWYGWVKDFYNIPVNKREFYAAHHLERFAYYKEYRLSICNGYPLSMKEHNENSDFYHIGEGSDITKWPDVAKLKYHTYDNFTFLDLNEVLRTDLILSEAFSKRLLLIKSKAHDKGQQFIPLYFDELLDDTKREKIFSLLRERVRKDYPCIYHYTGVKEEKYYARKLHVREVQKVEAIEFIRRTSLAGRIKIDKSFGLYKGNRLLQMMVFSKIKSKKVCYELACICTELNIHIIGGPRKILSYSRQFIRGPIYAYPDRRFESYDWHETIYHKLGFKYKGDIPPHYILAQPNTWKKYSAMLKHKVIIERQEEHYQNPSNGIRLYDCGNFVFVLK